MPKIIHLDFETRSEVDLTVVGAWAYSVHPSTDVLCFAYCIDEGPVKIVTRNNILMSENLGWPCQDLFDAIAEGAEVKAFNALFEQCIWQNQMVRFYGWPRVPIKQWRCVMAKALAHSLPRSLEACGEALKASIIKNKIGKSVMMLMCKPDKNGEWHESEENFQKLYKYCIDDVAAEREIDKMVPDLNPTEQTTWFLDQLINQRGFSIDKEAVKKAIMLGESHKLALNNNVLAASGGVLDGVTRRNCVLRWCQSQGVTVADYTKDVVKETLRAEGIPISVRTVLEAKLELGKTSVKKYEAMLASVTDDGRIRDTLIYHAATTGRWGGKIVQVHNLPKGNEKDPETAVEAIKRFTYEDFRLFYPQVMQTLSSCIRGMIISSPGYDLMVADFAAIEARVVMWLADEKVGLNQFLNGEDLYVYMARNIYQRGDIDKHSPERALGKAAVLGCGFGMGAPKFHSTCLAWGINISEDLAVRAVETYRATYPRVRSAWYEQERAAIAACQEKRSINCGKIFWRLCGSTLYARLPSGRDLAYNNARVRSVRTSWGEMKDAIRYDAVDDRNQWSEQGTYGGRLVENLTQAVARDILANAMLNIEKAGYKNLFSVHDEVVSEVPEGQGSVEEYEQLMCQTPKWAEGCPIKAEAWRGKRYRK